MGIWSTPPHERGAPVKASRQQKLSLELNLTLDSDRPGFLAALITPARLLCSPIEMDAQPSFCVILGLAPSFSTPDFSEKPDPCLPPI